MKFMKKIGAGVLSALMATAMVGCSGGGGDGATASTDSGSYKTTFTYAIGGEPNYLDPVIAGDSVTAFVTNQLYFPLFYIGGDGTMVNAACTDYKVSDDGLVYTLHLTEDNYWSDGQQVTANDYIFGMKHALNLGTADASYVYYLTNNIVGAAELESKPTAEMDSLGVTAPDDFTLVFNLKQKVPYFQSLLSGPVFYPLRSDYVPDGDYTWADDPSVPTNGPFHPVTIDRSSQVVMERNEHFVNNSDQDIVVETMTARVMADMDAELMAFQTGEIDFATSVDAATVNNVYAGQDELEITDSVMNYYLNINCFGEGNGNPALEDVNVRKALNYALDREEIVQALNAGDIYYPLYGLVPNGFKSDDGTDFREEGGDLTGYDPDQARELLAEAGYDESNPLELTYYYNQNTMHDTVAEVMKSQFAEVGINLTLQTGEIRTFFSDRSDGLYDIARNAFSADYMDVRTFLDLPLLSNQTVHTWGDETFDEMIFATDALDGAERTQALHDAERYLVEEMAYCIPVFGYKNVCLKKAGTTGQIGSPQANYVFWYVHVPE